MMHYFPIERQAKIASTQQKCLLNSSEGLHTMSFSGITQKLKVRLKANVLL